MYINQSLANINGFFGMNKSGMFHKEETKRKMSISHKGKIETEETKRKKSVALIGLIRSKETKLLISKANTGKQRTQEFREKQSIATKGENNPRYGYKYTILEKLQHSLKLKEGYASGKIKSQKGISKHKQEFKEKRSQEMQGEKHHNYGKIWINNGVINKYINSNAPIPESWCKGMMKKN